jgi:endoglucanase
MARGSITAQLDSGYLKNLTATVTHITGKGKFAVLDAHNYGRYNGAVITDTAAFATFWKNLATQFKSNANVVSCSLPVDFQRLPGI